MLEELSLAGSTVVVTGAASGIGRATCAVANELGGRVVAIDHLAQLDEVVATQPGIYGERAVPLVADVSDEATVAALPARLPEGRVAALINVVGVGVRAPVVSMTLEEWDRVIATSLTSMFLMSRAFIPLLSGSAGAIVNVSSTHAFVGLPLGGAYSAAKGGVVAFTRQLATELGTTGIRVNAVCPGPIDTRGRTGDVRPASAMSTVFGRTGAASEVANLIMFLASRAASFMTGAAVVIDGGQTIHRGLVDRSRVEASGLAEVLPEEGR